MTWFDAKCVSFHSRHTLLSHHFTSWLRACRSSEDSPTGKNAPRSLVNPVPGFGWLARRRGGCYKEGGKSGERHLHGEREPTHRSTRASSDQIGRASCRERV